MLAKRIPAEVTDDEKIRKAYRLVYQRAVTAPELEAAIGFLEERTREAGNRGTAERQGTRRRSGNEARTRGDEVQAQRPEGAASPSGRLDPLRPSAPELKRILVLELAERSK